MMNKTTDRILGVLGGMGPMATAKFYSDFVAETAAERDQDHPHVIINSNPSIEDRTAFLLGRGSDPLPKLIASALQLRASGAEVLAMPCNTASVFAAEISEAADVEFIGWVDSAVDDLADMQVSEVGILATTGTIKSRVYQNALDTRGIAHVVPDPEGQERVMAAIYGPYGLKTVGHTTPFAVELLLSAAEDLAYRGATALVLGCTELPLVLPADSDSWPVGAVDPARSVIVRAHQWLARTEVR